METKIEKEPTSIFDAARKLPELFKTAGKIYDQSSGTIYRSDKTIHGLHLAVLPYRDQYEFTTYSAGDKEDIQYLRSLLFSQQIFKTYDCSLCAIDDPNNAVIVSAEQNQLTINKKSPAVLIHHLFEGRNYEVDTIASIKYLITGTVPQYYYNHLLLSSVNHLPTYAVFLDYRVFYDLMLFLQLTSGMSPHVYAFFNGNFGSDIFHFHTHLTNQPNQILNYIAENYTQNGNFLYEKDIIRMSVFVHEDIHGLRDILYNRSIINIILNEPNLVCTANFFFKNNRYYVTIQIVKREKPFVYNGCSFFLLPASFILAASDCFKPPTDDNEYNLFTTSIKQYYHNTYQDPNIYLVEYNYNVIIQQILSQDIIEVLYSEYIEQLYVWMEHKRLSQDISENIIQILVNFLYDFNCYNPDKLCSHSDIGRFKYLVGLVFNYTKNTNLFNTEQVKEIMILSEYQRMKNMNKSGNITTEYMYFKGRFVQEFIYRTFENLLLLTSNSSNTEPTIQTSMITKWLNSTFKRIGEASASGINSIAEISLPDLNIDMVMKTMCNVQKRNKPPDSVQKEFIHEFFAGKEINDIRLLIPHFIITYGGFFCDSSSKVCNNSPVSGLCDRGPGNNITYLLIENIKNSKTLSRHIKTPMLAYENEANDMADCYMQIFIALKFGWEEKDFTHYDLHTNNVMLYDFITNTNFLQLFREYKENQTIVPEVKQVLFRYFTKENRQIIIPARYLMLIIDYGNSYVKNMPKNTYFSMPHRARIGMTADKKNLVADIYTFLMSVFSDIFVSKPYLVTNNQTWNNNILVELLQKTIQSYKELWIIPENMMNELLQVIIKRDTSLAQFFNSRIKLDYRFGEYRYLPPNFNPELVEEDFRGSGKVVEWMVNNHYKQMNLHDKINQKNIYVFDWGHLPENHIQGIQATPEIKNIIRENIDHRKLMASTMKQFMDRVP